MMKKEYDLSAMKSRKNPYASKLKKDEQYDFSKAKRVSDVPDLAKLQPEVKLSRWDSAEYLKTKEDIQLYMEACLEEAAFGDGAASVWA